MINKGVLQDDKSYVYTCHACGFKNAECPYCYGKDIDRCRAEIKTAKGQRYYALLKTILCVSGKEMHEFAKGVANNNGKFAVIDIGYVSLMFDLNFKATCEWLEETHLIRPGTYDNITANKIKVRDVYAAAKQKYTAPDTDVSP